MRHICWAPGLKPDVVSLNLLTCRLKRRIDYERSARTFLDLIRPKLRTSANYLAKTVGAPYDEIYQELEAHALMEIIHRYQIGGIAYPLHFLFGFRIGVISTFILIRIRQEKMYRQHIMHPESETHLTELAEQMQIEHGDDGYEVEVRNLQDILHDGVTLTTEEYALLSFYLETQMESERDAARAYYAHLRHTSKTDVNKRIKDLTAKLEVLLT
jgi:hypothetical protein